jgi:hypothetical protein
MPPKLAENIESESRADTRPRGHGRSNSALPLIDSERCPPNGHVWPEINTRIHDRQDWYRIAPAPDAMSLYLEKHARAVVK